MMHPHRFTLNLFPSITSGASLGAPVTVPPTSVWHVGPCVPPLGGGSVDQQCRCQTKTPKKKEEETF